MKGICICVSKGHGPEGCGLCNETGVTDGTNILLRCVTLENGGRVGLGRLPEGHEGTWAVEFVSPTGEETKLALSEQAMAALIALYRGRDRDVVAKWVLTLPADQTVAGAS